ASERNLRLRNIIGGAFFVYWWTDWNGWNPVNLQRIANYMRVYETGGGPVTDRVRQMSQSDEAHVRNFAFLLELHRGALIDAPSLTQNPSFEIGDTTASEWSVAMESAGSVQGVENIAPSGDSALRFRNVRRAEVSQRFAMNDGLTAVQL